MLFPVHFIILISGAYGRAIGLRVINCGMQRRAASHGALRDILYVTAGVQHSLTGRPHAANDGHCAVATCVWRQMLCIHRAASIFKRLA